MSLQSAFPFVFNFLPQKPIVVEVSNEALSTDGGLIPIRQFDEQIGFTRLIAMHSTIVVTRTSPLTASFP